MKAVFYQDGKRIDIVQSGDIDSGDIVVIGELIGVQTNQIKKDEKGSVAVSGVFQVVKKSADTFTAGQKVYWDNTLKQATSTASGNTLMGITVDQAGSSDSNVLVKIN